MQVVSKNYISRENITGKARLKCVRISSYKVFLSCGISLCSKTGNIFSLNAVISE